MESESGGRPWPALVRRFTPYRCLHPLPLAFLFLALALLSTGSLKVLGSTPVVAAKVFIIGDSTVAAYVSTDTTRGWGQEIYHYFQYGIPFVDNAVSGCSSKTFIAGGWWASTLAQTASNNYVLIQFGHNDSHDPSLPESTDANGDYKTYLQQYIVDTRSKGAIPILVTPMHRRSFDTNGVLLPYYILNGTNTGNLAPYAAAMKQVALSNNVPCVDLFASSGDFMQSIGNTRCIPMFISGDITHFNETGATIMAALVAQGISEVLPAPGVSANPAELTQYLRRDALAMHHADLDNGVFPRPIFTLNWAANELVLDWFIQPSGVKLYQSTNLISWTQWVTGATGTAGSALFVPQTNQAYFRLGPP
jgi:lysophospholipase L1-like esterase